MTETEVQAKDGTTKVEGKKETTGLNCLGPKEKSSILPDEAALYTVANVKKNERILHLENILKTNEWDSKAWLGILKETLSPTSDLDTGRFYFDCFFRKFPQVGINLKSYLDFEIHHGNIAVVQNIFQKYLQDCVNVELWRSYLIFVDSQNKDGPPSEHRSLMTKAYEFALENVGLDVYSTVIVRDYIDFMKKWNAQTTFDQSEKMLIIRQIYHNALKNPIYQIVEIWGEYAQFEKDSGGQILMEKKFRDEHQTTHMKARDVLQRRLELMEKVVRNTLSVPVSLTAKEKQQLDLWKKYIEYEKSNPLKLENAKEVQRRVVFAYKQCLQCFSFHPDIWLQYALYLEPDPEACAGVYQKGSEAVPTNFLIAFAYADFEEKRGNNDKVKNIYEKLLKTKGIDPTLVYIQFMRFANRVAGMGMNKVRDIFKKARKDSRCSYHIWLTNANLEYHFGKKDFSTKVFELGRQKCATDKEYLYQYIEYLTNLNRHNEIEVLYRQMTRTFPPEDRDDIWVRYLRFVINHFPLEKINKVEKDFIAHVEGKKENRIYVTVERYRYLDLLPCSKLECESFGVNPIQLSNSTIGSTTSTTVAEEAEETYSMPDVSQLIKFNPENACTTAEYLAPKSVLKIMKNTVQRGVYRDPLVDIDELLKIISTVEIPNANGKRSHDQSQADAPTSSMPSLYMDRRRKVAKL